MCIFHLFQACVFVAMLKTPEVLASGVSAQTSPTVSQCVFLLCAVVAWVNIKYVCCCGPKLFSHTGMICTNRKKVISGAAEQQSSDLGTIYSKRSVQSSLVNHANVWCFKKHKKWCVFLVNSLQLCDYQIIVFSFDH